MRDGLPLPSLYAVFPVFLLHLVWHGLAAPIVPSLHLSFSHFKISFLSVAATAALAAAIVPAVAVAINVAIAVAVSIISSANRMKQSFPSRSSL